MKMFPRVPILLALVLACGTPGVLALDIQRINVTTVVNSGVPSVRLDWDEQADGIVVKIYRREFGLVGQPGGNALVSVGSVPYPGKSFTDPTVTTGQAYEYRVLRPAFSSGGANYKKVAAYVAVTVEAPTEEDRGKVLLVVDSSLPASMEGPLRLLETDLAGDGWRVHRLSFAPQGKATPKHSKRQSWPPAPPTPQSTHSTCSDICWSPAQAG